MHLCQYINYHLCQYINYFPYINEINLFIPDDIRKSPTPDSSMMGRPDQ